jgi:hypothetical protein
MGIFARFNKLGEALRDGLARKANGDKQSSPPLLAERQPLTPIADNRQREQAPIVLIRKPPPRVDDFDEDSPPPLPRKTKVRPEPLDLPPRSISQATLTVQNDQPQSSSSIHHRCDSLVSSSLVTPRTPSALAARQRRDELDNDARMEELKSTPPKDDKIEPREDLHGLGVSSSSSKGGTNRLFRRASEKVIDRRLSRQSSRNGYDDLLETLGRSLSSTSHLSMTSLASTRSFAAASNKQDVDSHGGRSSPSLNTVWRRGRAASSASSKENSPPLSSPASFSRPFSRSQVEINSTESPLTPHTSNGPVSFPSVSPPPDDEEGLVVTHRWRKLSKKTLRARHSNGADSDSIQLYMLRLSPPPRGLAADDIVGRKRVVCSYVHGRLSEEKRKSTKSAYMRPLTAAPSTLPTTTAEDCIETLEDVFQTWMNEDIKQESDAQQYRELHLADVFIEARRSLGVNSMSTRLRSMFDISQMQVPNATTLEARRDSRAMELPSTSSPPPSAWDNSLRKQTSLTPAPRRRRRPKTTPTNHSCSVDDLHQSEATFNEDSQSFSNSSNLSHHPKANTSIDSSLDGINSSKWTKDSPHQKTFGKSSPVTFPMTHDPASLPPSPPKSIDSHHFAEVTPYTAPSSTRILSEVLAL